MKIDEYDFKGLSPDLIEWINSVTELLNVGKYSFRSGVVPTSGTRGQSGDHVIAKDGASWYFFIYSNDTDGWKKLELLDI